MCKQTAVTTLTGVEALVSEDQVTSFEKDLDLLETRLRLNHRKLHVSLEDLYDHAKLGKIFAERILTEFGLQLISLLSSSVYRLKYWTVCLFAKIISYSDLGCAVYETGVLKHLVPLLVGTNEKIIKKTLAIVSHLTYLRTRRLAIVKIVSVSSLVNLLSIDNQKIQVQILRILMYFTLINPVLYDVEDEKNSIVEREVAALHELALSKSLHYRRVVKVLRGLSFWPRGVQVLLDRSIIPFCLNILPKVKLRIQWIIVRLLDGLAYNELGLKQLRLSNGEEILSGLSSSGDDFSHGLMPRTVANLINKLSLIPRGGGAENATDGESASKSVAHQRFLQLCIGPLATEEFVPSKEKPTGKDPGCWSISPDNITYLTKYCPPPGVWDDLVRLIAERQTETGRLYGAFREKIVADFYGVFGSRLFLTPNHKLGMQQINNPFTDAKYVDELAVVQMRIDDEEGDSSRALHLGSRKILGYRDLHNLDNCKISKYDADRRPFIQWVEDEGRIPEYVEVEDNGAISTVRILGAIPMLAAGCLVADTDVWGVSKRNAGYIYERNCDDKVVAVRLVKVDAGEAFNFAAGTNRFSNRVQIRLGAHHIKTIQYANSSQVQDIQWENLSSCQQYQFLGAIRAGLQLLRSPGFMQLLILRNGLFDRIMTELNFLPLMSNAYFGPSLMGKWQRHLRQQEVAFFQPLEPYPSEEIKQREVVRQCLALEFHTRFGCFGPRSVGAVDYSHGEIADLVEQVTSV